MKFPHYTVGLIAAVAMVSFGSTSICSAQGVNLPPADLKPGQPYRVLAVSPGRRSPGR